MVADGRGHAIAARAGALHGVGAVLVGARAGRRAASSSPTRRSSAICAPRTLCRNASTTLPRTQPASRARHGSRRALGAKLPSRRTPATAMKAWPRFQLGGKDAALDAEVVARRVEQREARRRVDALAEREREGRLGARVLGRVRRPPRARRSPGSSRPASCRPRAAPRSARAGPRGSRAWSPPERGGLGARRGGCRARPTSRSSSCRRSPGTVIES